METEPFYMYVSTDHDPSVEGHCVVLSSSREA